MATPNRSARLKFDIVERNFNRYLTELAALVPEKEYSTVIRAEAVSIAQAALRRTRAASVKSIRQAAAAKEYTTFGGKRYKLSNRYPNPLWAQIKAYRKTLLENKLGARGLAKKSWVQLGAHLGQTLLAPEYVYRANPPGRSLPDNGAVRETAIGPAYGLTLINTSPIVRFAGGERALRLAMLGRIGYFRRNLENRAFATAASRAQKYPGIFVKPITGGSLR